jgi:hypothetical protein
MPQKNVGTARISEEKILCLVAKSEAPVAKSIVRALGGQIA